MRKVALAFILLLCCNFSFSQAKYFYGKLIDSLTLLPVQDVQVYNINTHEGDITNDRGLFVIQGNVNDTLQFIKVDYWGQRFLLQGNIAAQKDTLTIFLAPKISELHDVVVSSYSYKDYQQDSSDRRNNFRDAVGYAHPLFESSNSGSGIGFSLDRIFDSKQKNKKRAYKLFTENEEQKYIDYRFNPILLHSLTGFKGDQLHDFIYRYEPSYKWLREHTSYDDILFYVNEKLKDYNHR